MFACPTSPIVADDGSNEEIWFALNAPVCAVWAEAVADCELATDCVEAAGFESGPSEPTDTAWEAVRSAFAEAAAVALFDWERPARTPELTTLRFVGWVWVACAIAWASWEAEICWLMAGPRGAAMSGAPGAETSGAGGEAMPGAEAESEPIASETVWVAAALALAVASADTVFDCATCGVATPSVDPPEASAPISAGVGEAVTGAPVHAQFHTQLQSQAWLMEKRAAAPFDPVHVQFQIHRPATAAGPAEVDEAEEAEEAAEEDVELDVAEASVEEVWEAIHDQIQSEPAVDASATSLGRTLSVQVQFQIHASAPVGTTTVLPGRMTLTLMLFWPAVVALAETAFAVDVLVCAEIVSAPALPIRTEMLTLVGFVCTAVAADEETSGTAPDEIVDGVDDAEETPLGHAEAHWSSVWVTFEELPTSAGASPAFPADEPVLSPGGDNPVFGSTAAAWAEAVFVWMTPSDAPGLAILTETLTLVGDDCVVVALGAALPAASPPAPADALADASFA